MPSLRPALARRTSYFSLSRAPRYSVLFALPLLIAYEALAALLPQPRGLELRNGADALLRGAFMAFAGPYGSAIFMTAVILLGVWLVARDLKASGGGLRGRVFLGMSVESLALALVFGLVIGTLTQQLLGSLKLSLAPVQETSAATRLMLSLGAGLYEELFFRVLLVSALTVVGRSLFGFGGRAAAVFAAVLSALIFSAFHYIGAYGDPLELQSFTFRFLAGLAFSGLYILRGFGITAWTHALYDVFILLG